MKSKSLLRREARKLRRNLHVETLAPLLVERIATIPAVADADSFLLYAPMAGEVNLLGLMEYFPEKAAYLPRITPDNQLEFHRYQPGDAMETHPYGMPEPLASALALPPEAQNLLVIVPALMADEQGTRLGYGKSFYDRFLRDLRENNRKAITITAIPDTLLTERLPTDPWDEPVDWVVTEKRTLEARC